MSPGTTSDDANLGLTASSQTTTARDCTRSRELLDRARRPAFLRRTKPDTQHQHAADDDAERISPMTPRSCAMTSSWMTSGLRHRSSTSRRSRAARVRQFVGPVFLEAARRFLGCEATQPRPQLLERCCRGKVADPLEAAREGIPGNGLRHRECHGWPLPQKPTCNRTEGMGTGPRSRL